MWIKKCYPPHWPLCTLSQVRAFTTICASNLKSAADLSSVLEPALAEITGFLRKANRMLRQASLVALEVRSGSGSVARSGSRFLFWVWFPC